jgi:hypothetical protein
MEIFMEIFKKETTEGPDIFAKTLNKGPGSKSIMKHYNKIQNKSETKREFIRGRT